MVHYSDTYHINVCLYKPVTVAPLFGPARLTGPNRIQDALIPLKCSNPRASPNPVGESEPKPEDARSKPLIKSIYQIHFINISVFVLKSLRERFQVGQVYKHYKLNAIPLQNMHLTKNGILCRLQHDIQNHIQIWVQK